MDIENARTFSLDTVRSGVSGLHGDDEAGSAKSTRRSAYISREPSPNVGQRKERSMSAQSVAVITGAAKGIGWATVEAFIASGVVPVLFDRDAQALDQARRTLSDRGVEHFVQPVDITDEAAVEAAFATVERRYGRL